MCMIVCELLQILSAPLIYPGFRLKKPLALQLKHHLLRTISSWHTGRALDSAMAAAAVEPPQSVLTAVAVPDAKTVPRVSVVYHVLYVHVCVSRGRFLHA